jgi:hypothetical protein
VIAGSRSLATVPRAAMVSTSSRMSHRQRQACTYTYILLPMDTPGSSADLLICMLAVATRLRLSVVPMGVGSS